MTADQLTAKAVGCPVMDATAVRERAYTIILNRALARMTKRELTKQLREAWKDLQFEREVPDMEAKHPLYKLQ